jgi:DNA-binding response OmpR family regulator
LLDHIWGRSSYIEIRTVDVHVLRLRKNTRAYWSGRSDPDRAQRGLSFTPVS